MTDRPPLVTPFHGVRFADTTRLSRVIAPPYDVVSPAERAVLADSDPHNVVRYILPEGGDDRYQEAGALLTAWADSGVLADDEEESVTVLAQTFRAPDGHEYRRTGVIAAVAVEPFEGGRVKPHERTHRGPKEDRLALLRASSFIFESLLMFAPDRDLELHREAQAAQAGPALAEAVLGDEQLAVWRVSGDAAHRIAAAAGKADLYIADGHHRYETAIAYRSDNPAASRVPALLVSLADPGLVVAATHRVIVGEALEAAVVGASLRERFQIKELPSGDDPVAVLDHIQGRGTACAVVMPSGEVFALLVKGGDALTAFSTGLHATLSSLDVMRIDELVVKPLLAVSGAGARLEYSADAQGTIRRVRSGDAGCAILLNPTPVESVIAVADAGEVMPPKSTYFYPKVPSGIVGLRYTPRATMGSPST
jgi:uncharacterized protein (DUF1015 family)